MNPLIPIIAEYGLPFALELVKMLKDKDTVPTPEDFEALITKYASTSAERYLENAKAKATLLTLSPKNP